MIGSLPWLLTRLRGAGKGWALVRLGEEGKAQAALWAVGFPAAAGQKRPGAGAGLWYKSNRVPKKGDPLPIGPLPFPEDHSSSPRNHSHFLC